MDPGRCGHCGLRSARGCPGRAGVPHSGPERCCLRGSLRHEHGPGRPRRQGARAGPGPYATRDPGGVAGIPAQEAIPLAPGGRAGRRRISASDPWSDCQQPPSVLSFHCRGRAPTKTPQLWSAEMAHGHRRGAKFRAFRDFAKRFRAPRQGSNPSVSADRLSHKFMRSVLSVWVSPVYQAFSFLWSRVLGSGVPFEPPVLSTWRRGLMRSEALSSYLHHVRPASSRSRWTVLVEATPWLMV